MTAIQLLNTIILYHTGIIVSISYLTECIQFLLLLYFICLYNIYRLAFMAKDKIYIEIHERFSTHARWFTFEENFIRTKKFLSCLNLGDS